MGSVVVLRTAGHETVPAAAAGGGGGGGGSHPLPPGGWVKWDDEIEEFVLWDTVKRRVSERNRLKKGGKMRE